MYWVSANWVELLCVEISISTLKCYNRPATTMGIWLVPGKIGVHGLPRKNLFVSENGWIVKSDWTYQANWHIDYLTKWYKPSDQ